MLWWNHLHLRIGRKHRGNVVRREAAAGVLSWGGREERAVGEISPPSTPGVCVCVSSRGGSAGNAPEKPPVPPCEPGQGEQILLLPRGRRRQDLLPVQPPGQGGGPILYQEALRWDRFSGGCETPAQPPLFTLLVVLNVYRVRLAFWSVTVFLYNSGFQLGMKSDV